MTPQPADEVGYFMYDILYRERLTRRGFHEVLGLD